MKNFKVCKFFSRVESDSIGITIFVIFSFIDPLKRLGNFLYRFQSTYPMIYDGQRHDLFVVHELSLSACS